MGQGRSEEVALLRKGGWGRGYGWVRVVLEVG